MYLPSMSLFFSSNEMWFLVSYLPTFSDNITLFTVFCFEVFPYSFFLNDIISRFIISSQEEAISYWHVRNRGHWGKRHGFETLICNQYNLKGYITVGYRGTFAIGRGDMSTTGFRKLTRILVCGKSALCREVFKVKL